MRLFLLLITISISSTAVVEWIPNTSFNLPMNFRDHKLPCSRQAVVLPEIVEESIGIESVISVKEIVLPNNGELFLEDAIISFGPDAQDNCTDTGSAYYTPKTELSWADPDVWSSSKFNKATPDAERVPCYNDEVMFPSNTQFTINLPNEVQYIKKLTIASRSFSTDLFSDYVNQRYSEEVKQLFVVNEYYSTGLYIQYETCTDPTGCPCQMNVLNINCGLKFCPAPKCKDPIKPIGFCCEICGGYLLLNKENNIDMLAFEETVKEIVNYFGKDNLEYHIGIINSNKVQLVVVDKGEYEGTSIQALSDISEKINKKGFQNMAYISGVPTYKTGLGAKIMISMFFVVVLAMGAVYVYYYKMPRLPEFSYPRISRSTRGVLSRFSRRSESVVSLTSRRDSTATIGSEATAFRNPMYDSRRGRVQMTGPSLEEE